MAAEYVCLPLYPIQTGTGLAVRDAAYPFAECLPDRTEHRVRVRKRNAADEKNFTRNRSL